MTFHRSARRAIAATFALTLLVAACGGDDDSPETDTESTTTAAAGNDSTTTTADDGTTTESTAPEDEGPDAEEIEEAEALAESINLSLSDFADGWEESPASGEDGTVDECFQDITIDDVEIASVDSPTFSISTEDGSQGQVVQTSTIVLDEEASGEAIIAEIGTNQFAGCAEDALIASVEEDGGEITNSDLNPVADEGGLGDEAIGLAGAISFIPEGGTEADGQLALYFIRTDNVVTAISILDIGDLAFADTLADLLAEVATRQAENV